MTARLLVAERLPNLRSPSTPLDSISSEGSLRQPQLRMQLCGVASTGVAAAEQSSFRVPTESVLLSGTIFNMNELPSRKTRPTSMQVGSE